MPGCAAFGCNNRSEKGYSMKCFPRDPLLRKEWKKRVGRANWEPSKNSFLCHVHFEPQQWVQTTNGKIRLRKDAMPSIFTETSTRKSPKKRRLENGEWGANDSNVNENVVWIVTAKGSDEESEDDNFVLEYIDESESNMGVESKESKINIGKSKHSSTAMKLQQLTAAIERGCLFGKKNSSELVYRIATEKDMRTLEKENVIIVSDENNREIGKLVHNNEDVVIVADENNKEIGQIVVEKNMLNPQIPKSNAGHETEVQRADIPVIQNSYDEIEEKLKQICNGEDVDTPIARRDLGDTSLIPLIEIVCKNEAEIPKKNSSEQNLDEKYFDKEIPRNVQIIFGTESGDESQHASELNSSSNMHELQNHLLNNSERKSSAKVEDSTEKNKSVVELAHLANDDVNKLMVENANDLTSIRTALKQKKKTREQMMRSIERTIADLSERTLRNLKNEQLTNSILRFARSRKRRNNEKKEELITSGYNKRLKVINRNIELVDCESPSAKKSKFTIKVTGIADDVSEILEGLENVSGHMTPKSRDEANSSSFENARHSIVSDDEIRDSQEQSSDSLDIKEEQLSDFGSIVSKDGCRSGKNRSRKNVKLKVQSLNDDDEASMWLKYFSNSQKPSRGLKQKINAQQEVIDKLTHQLIIYRGLETTLKRVNVELENKDKEIKILKERLNERLQTPVQNCKKEIEIKQQTISNLNNKINQLEEANKKLTARISAEPQEKRMGYQLKQKDEKIKELNWKLEKASKFLDRAEKNANTYKRKMLSMQTAMRRQKVSEEKQSQFKALLIDNAKHEFSESALLTAMDIKTSCGIKCYEKLLSYNFPLPSLRTLRRRYQKENATDDWGDEDQELVNTEDQTDMAELEVSRTYETGETEITGTVQDIFEENNDVDDFNSSELGEHIFSQLVREGNT